MCSDKVGQANTTNNKIINNKLLRLIDVLMI